MEATASYFVLYGMKNTNKQKIVEIKYKNFSNAYVYKAKLEEVPILIILIGILNSIQFP